jgi:arylformamidase
MYWENEYNPRVRVADAERHFDVWARRAERARAALKDSSLDVVYGTHPRERLDVFHAESARGTLVFLHGGYWRAFGKETQSWIAEAFVRMGISVVIPNYPLAPQARIAEIVTSLSGVFGPLQQALGCGELRRVVVAGHSAGAHLAACLLARSETGATRGMLDAIVCISGIFDLVPLLHTRMLVNMGWTAEELHAVSPLFMPPPARGAVVLAVGAEESREFCTQTARMADAWASSVKGVLSVEGRNHFTVVDELHDPGSELFRQVVGSF